MNTPTHRPDAGRPVAAIVNSAKRMQDADFRRRLRNHDADALSELGYRPAPDVTPEFKVVTSTRDICYVPMPPRPSPEVSLDTTELRRINAADGTASTAGSAGTLGCFPSCLSSASSAGSAGTATSG